MLSFNASSMRSLFSGFGRTKIPDPQAALRAKYPYGKSLGNDRVTPFTPREIPTDPKAFEEYVKRTSIGNLSKKGNFSEENVRRVAAAPRYPGAGMSNIARKPVATLDTATKTKNLDNLKATQRKPVLPPRNNDSGYASFQRESPVKPKASSEQLSPSERQSRDFELQRVTQSIPGWVLKEHPHIANSFNEDRSHYTSSMYDQAIKSYQAFIPGEYL
jgi:hypothetical protein